MALPTLKSGFIVLFALVAGSAVADPGLRIPDAGRGWPMFRGNPQLTGIAPADSLPEKLELLWTFKTGAHVESSAAIVDGVVFIGTDNGNDGAVLAIDLKTGTELWKYKAENPVRSSPAVADGGVFAGDDGGIVYGVDAKTGKELWKFKTDDKIPGSPVVHAGKVLVGSFDSFLYAVNAADGKLAWKFKTEDQPVNCTPAVAGGHAFVAGCDQFLRVVDITTGKEAAAISMDAQCGASPAVIGDKAYVGTFGNQVLCIDWKRQKVDWTYKHPDKEFPYYSSAAVTDELVVVGGRDKMVHGIGRVSGKSAWTFATRGKVDSSPVVVGKRVFVGSHDGNLYELDLNTGEKRWSFACGSPVSARPAVGDGRLVIAAEDGPVYCFGKK